MKYISDEKYGFSSLAEGVELPSHTKTYTETSEEVKAWLAAQADKANAFEAKQANSRKSALEKLAAVAGLTADEVAAL